MARLNGFERRLFLKVTAALVAAKADDCLVDRGSLAHRIQDAAMVQVEEWRIRVHAERMRRRRLARGRREGRER